MIVLIVARNKINGIGCLGGIPWRNQYDVEWFKKNTINHVVIMGNITYKSIGKPLSDRINIVITNDCDKKHNNENLFYFTDIINAIIFAEKTYPTKIIFVIGGASIYDYFKQNRLIDKELITEIDNDVACDRYYLSDNLNDNLSDNNNKVLLTKLQDGTSIYQITHVNHEEMKFLELMKEILHKGYDSDDRTNIGTKSLFGRQLTFNLRHGTFPLLTTRKMFFKGIFEELMFYLRGDTNALHLAEKGVKVWLPNTTREELDKRQLHNMPVGDMGHSYGFSFRHFGGEYKTCMHDYNDYNGFDQLTWLINEIKTNPNSRRLIISLWEPNMMHKTVLPPCLYQYQFYVRDGYLSCMMTQRSSDYFTAGGWNVATGALLTYLISIICNLKPDQLIWNIGDVHLYKNLIEQANMQITRTPFLWPKIIIKKKTNITDFTYDDVKIYKYQYHPAINGCMNV